MYMYRITLTKYQSISEKKPVHLLRLSSVPRLHPLLDLSFSELCVGGHLLNMSWTSYRSHSCQIFEEKTLNILCVESNKMLNE